MNVSNMSMSVLSQNLINSGEGHDMDKTNIENVPLFVDIFVGYFDLMAISLLYFFVISYL